MDHVDPEQVPARRQLRSDLVSALVQLLHLTEAGIPGLKGACWLW